MATLLHKNLCPRGDEFHNFCKPFLNYHYYTLSLTEACPRVDKTIFKEIQQFYTFYPRITFPWGWGHETYNFWSSYPTDASYQIWPRLAH